mmetsp:Transcript_17250/g.38173  ORF Transcript_17250/g.38173 Transcript_17250/m.38173 type:complete len:103 (+) Transcript_17250:1265-1573(+)
MAGLVSSGPNTAAGAVLESSDPSLRPGDASAVSVESALDFQRRTLGNSSAETGAWKLPGASGSGRCGFGLGGREGPAEVGRTEGALATAVSFGRATGLASGV